MSDFKGAEMNNARKKAEHIVSKASFVSSILHPDDTIRLVELIEQALKGAGPRIVSGPDLEDIAAEFLKRTGQQAQAFYEGFRAAERMNAVAHMEQVWPSTGAVTQWVAEYIEKNGTRPNEAETSTWLRAKVLHILKEQR